MKKIIFLISILILGLASSPALAKIVTSGDFKMDYTDPIFTVTNAVPGEVYQSEIITVTNTGDTPQNVQFKIDIATDSEALAKMLYLKVTDNENNCL